MLSTIWLPHSNPEQACMQTGDGGLSHCGTRGNDYWARSIMWAASSEFVSSSIPSWQILTAHAQPFRGARDLAFCLKVPLDSLLVWASSGGSGQTARMRRLAWTFSARIGDKYQIRLPRPMWSLVCHLVLMFYGAKHVKKQICLLGMFSSKTCLLDQASVRSVWECVYYNMYWINIYD